MPANSEKEMVGAQLPGRLFQLINLYSTTRNVSKSQIFRDSLLLWIEQNEISLEQLTQELALQYKAKWLRVKNEEYKSPSIDGYKKFIDEHKRELESLKVSKQIIEQVFKKFQNETN